jgi:TRAP-type C4-dicarboxylate transport system permease small subunit
MTAAIIAASLERLARSLAYLGGLVVAGVGLLSTVSILGRSAMSLPLFSYFSRPITGDFELVEIGTAVAGSLFLPYCQLSKGHIIVDFFTLKIGEHIKGALDRLGALLMAVTYLIVGWRTAVGCADIYGSGETSMLLGFPIWIGYAATVPGVLVAGVVALSQAAGLRVTGPPSDE